MLDKDDQEFEAAFKDASAGKPNAEETPHDQADGGDGSVAADPLQDTEAAPAPPVEQPDTNQPDIWSNATPEQRAAFQAASDQAQQLEHRLKSDDGRVSRFQRERDKMRQNLETLLAASQTDGDELSALVQGAQWRKSKADYGDDLGPLFAVIEKLAQRSDGISERFQQSDNATIEQITAENDAILDEKAPDWKPLLGRTDFVPWLRSQAKPWQDAFEANRERVVDPEAAAELVSKFRAHVFLTEQANPPKQSNPTDPRRAAQLDASRSPNSRQPILADAMDSDDFEMVFGRAAAEREKAQASARPFRG